MQRAVALLHSFQYQLSEETFHDASLLDPRCAMAYWGKAMALYHQLWDWPSDEILMKGYEYVNKAESIGAGTRREREYITAAAAFFQKDTNLSRLDRAAAYSHAIQEVHLDFPRDSDATAFYALSLIALPVHGAAERANRNRAVKILLRLFAADPDHPGAAHYLIHAADTRQLAHLGLLAARRYAKIAPDSAHALHMPSHIFLRLGLWHDVIRSNLASATAAARATEANADNEVGYQLHAMDFLDYAYLQDGQMAKAELLVKEVAEVPGLGQQEIRNKQAYYLLKNALELHNWNEAAVLVFPTDSQAMTYWGRALGAAHIGDPIGATENFRELHKLVVEARAQAMRMGCETCSGETIEEQEAESWVAFSENHTTRAIKLMRAAARHEDKEGVVSLAIPAREMLGDLFMEIRKPRKAFKEYKIALIESPNRFDSLYGAARAAQLLGNVRAAKEYYRKLIAICTTDADRPELRTARMFLGSADLVAHKTSR